MSSKVFSPDPNIVSLLDGGQYFIPPVTTGNSLSTRGWSQEAVLRMMLNHCEMSVSQYFSKLPPYIYEEKIDWQNLKDNLNNLLSLEDDQTLIIESGKSQGIYKSKKEAPRVININSETCHFDDYQEESLYVYNKMLNKSWTSIGAQDSIDDNYHIFERIAARHFSGNYEAKIFVTSGAGYTGIGQALAVTMNGGVVVIIEPDHRLLDSLQINGYCNRVYYDVDTAFDVAADAKRSGQARAIGLVGNASEIIPELVNKGIIPAMITDASNFSREKGYFPAGYSYHDALRVQKADSHHFRNLSKHSVMMHVKAMAELNRRGSIVFEYGNRIREIAHERGLYNAFSFPEYISEYAYPLITGNMLNFKWTAISNNPEDIFLIDDMIVSEFSYNQDLSRLIDLANKIVVPGIIPSRKSRLTTSEGIKLYKIINEMVRNEEVSAPVLLEISRFQDFRQDKNNVYLTKDTPKEDIINKIINQPNGSDWISMSYMGEGEDYYLLSEMMIIADGTKETEIKIETIADNLKKQ